MLNISQKAPVCLSDILHAHIGRRLYMNRKRCLDWVEKNFCETKHQKPSELSDQTVKYIPHQQGAEFLGK